MGDLATAIRLLKEARASMQMWFADDSNLDELDAARSKIGTAIDELEQEESAR
jgi:hypothetical protein